MYVLVTYKNEENHLKDVGARVWQEINFIQSFMEVLVTCKNEEDPFKNEAARVVTIDLPL